MHPTYDHVKHTNNCAAIQFRLYLSTPKHVFEAIDKYTQSKAQTHALTHAHTQSHTHNLKRMQSYTQPNLPYPFLRCTLNLPRTLQRRNMYM